MNKISITLGLIALATSPGFISAASDGMPTRGFASNHSLSFQPGRQHIEDRHVTAKDVRIKSSDAVYSGQEILSLHPTEDEFKACTIVDGNKDNVTITYFCTVDLNGQPIDWPIYYINEGTDLPADEWIFAPAVTLDDNTKLYQAQIDARVGTPFNKESFEVVVATAPRPDAVIAIATDCNLIDNYVFETFTGNFGIENPGQYYIGVHIKSPKNGWRIMLRDLKVVRTDRSAEIPATVSDLKLTADPKGALSADVAFTMPTKTLTGKTIPAGTTLTATVTSNAETKTVTGTPGNKVTTTIKAVDGLNTISVSISNQNGSNTPISGVVRCGLDIPLDPTVTGKISDDNMSLTLSWETPTQGSTGGVIDPTTLLYNVYIFTLNENTGQGEWKIEASNIKENSWTYTTDNEVQGLYEFLVTALNNIGESDGSETSYTLARLGRPYNIPMIEKFEGGFKYPGITSSQPDESYVATWGISNTASLWPESGEYYALIGLNNVGDGVSHGRLELPVFYTSGTRKVNFSATIYLTGLTPTSDLLLINSKGVTTKIGTVSHTSGEGWQTLSFDIPDNAIENTAWAYIAIDATFLSKDQILMMRDYSIRERKANDVAVSDASVSDNVRHGEPFTISGTITNYGYQTTAMVQPTVIISSGNDEIARLTPDISGAPTSLTPSESVEFSTEYTIRPADYVGKQMSATIVLDTNDDDTSNNRLDISFSPAQSRYTVIDGLNGVMTDDGGAIDLTWNNPIKDTYTDGFELLNHGDYSSQLGDWRNLDLDGKETWSINETMLPYASYPKAFQVINTVTQAWDGLAAFNGSQMLLAFSAEEAATDDWLISPQLKPGSPLSFWISSISTEYPESVEVLASTTADDLDSFNSVKKLTLDDANWQHIEVDLPEGTEYFAINYNSNNQFGIMLDDITYEPLTRSYDVIGFNVYRNGNRIADKLTSAAYRDAVDNLEAQHYNVAAVALISGIETELPWSRTFCLGDKLSLENIDTANISVAGSTGAIIFNGFAGRARADIYDTAGRLTATPIIDGSLSQPMQPGIYIVKIAGSVFKVAVR